MKIFCYSIIIIIKLVVNYFDATKNSHTWNGKYTSEVEFYKTQAK